MTDTTLNIMGWWIEIIEVPILTALFWMIAKLRDEVTAHKVEVAKTYAQNSDVRLLESRLTAHLLRIEAKLDVTALKAEKLSTHNGGSHD